MMQAKTKIVHGHRCRPDSALPGACDAIHATVTESEGWYVAECREAAVVTQSRTLDGLAVNLREALELYFDDENIAPSSRSSALRLALHYETRDFPSRS